MLPIFNTRLSNTIDGCWHFDHWLRSEDHKDHSGSDPFINVQAWQSQLWSLKIRTIFFTGVGWWEASLQKPDLETLVSGSRSLTTDPWHFKLNNIDHLDEKLNKECRGFNHTIALKPRFHLSSESLSTEMFLQGWLIEEQLLESERLRRFLRFKHSRHPRQQSPPSHALTTPHCTAHWTHWTYCTY